MLTADDVLSHHGIKGMKWGVRRTRAQLDADSEDTAKAKSVKAQIKANRGSTDSVSNKDLQSLVTRMNLEQQYKNLSTKNPERTKGQKFVDDIFSGPAPSIALAIAKTKMSDNKDPRVKLGLNVADAIVQNVSKKKK